MGYKYDYSKLKGRITEKIKKRSAFAEKMQLSETTINYKLSGKIEFKQSEILNACRILDIPDEDMKKYFFSTIS